MNNMEKLESFRPMFLALILGIGIIISEIDFTFGEVCIISTCFYLYLNLKEMILKVGTSQEETQ